MHMHTRTHTHTSQRRYECCRSTSCVTATTNSHTHIPPHGHPTPSRTCQKNREHQVLTCMQECCTSARIAKKKAMPKSCHILPKILPINLAYNDVSRKFLLCISCRVFSRSEPGRDTAVSSTDRPHPLTTPPSSKINHTQLPPTYVSSVCSSSPAHPQHLVM